MSRFFSPTVAAKLALLAAVAAGVLGLRFGWAGLAEAVEFQRRCGYGFMAAMVGAWLWFFGRAAGGENWLRRALAPEHRAAWLALAAATVFLHAFEPHVMRVFFDEPTQTVGALSMHLRKSAMLPDRSHWIDGRFVLLGENATFRPYLFAFLASLLHDLTGFRPANVHVLNGLLTPVVLGSAYLVARRAAGAWAGWFALALLTTLPLLAQVATSGGYDLLHVALLGLFACLVQSYLGAPPGDDRRVGRLADAALATVLLATANRSEAVLLLAPWCAAVVVRWRRDGRAGLTGFAVLSPVLLLPNLMVQAVHAASEPALQGGLRGAGETFFSASYLPGHLANAARYLADCSLDQTNSLPLTLVGVAGLVGGGLAAARRRVAGPAEAVVIVTGFFVTAAYVFVLSQFWSDPLDPLVTRFALPMHWAWAVVGGGALAAWITRERRRLFVLIALGAWAGAFAAPAAARATKTHALPQSRAEHVGYEFVGRAGRESVLVVARSNYGWTAQGFAGSDLEALGANPAAYVRALAAGLYREILVFQVVEVEPRTGGVRPAAGNQLPDRVVLEPAAALPVSATVRVHVWRLKGFRDAAGATIAPGSADPAVAVRKDFASEAERRAYRETLLP